MTEDSSPPLYEQVRRRLLSQIDAGVFPEGSFLPSEVELCETFGVSRVTLRRAVAELCSTGRLIRQQGRGTLVGQRRLQQPISLSGFSDAVEGMGRKASHRVLARDDAPEPVAALPRLEARRPIRFERLLEVDDRATVLETLWFDAEAFDRLIPHIEQGGSFFAALRLEYGLSPQGADREIDVGFASPAEAAQLAMSSAQPVYRIEKLVTGEGGTPLALSQVVIPCHLVTLRLKT